MTSQMLGQGGEYIYLDYAATSPLCEEAHSAMEPYMQAGRAAAAGPMNANSLHGPGRVAFKALEEARRAVACAIGARRPDQVVFTSGATEADNASIAGIAKAAREVRTRGNRNFTPEIVSSQIEHDAVLAQLKQLEREGFAVKLLAPDRDGFVEVRKLEEAVGPDTVLVTVQTANSEIGSIQPVRQLADVAHSHGAYFHTDATQALGKMPLSVDELGVDAASFSSHKVGGPKGAGAMFLGAGVPFQAQALGGGQEGGRRSGTQNVVGAVGFAAACKAACDRLPKEADRLRELRDELYRGLASFELVQPTVEVEAGSLDYLPNIVNVMVSGMESETLVLRLDALGFATSGGSACSSSSLDPSHVLTSLGIQPDAALGELRVSLGRYTTREDVGAFLAAMPKVLDWK